MSNIDISGPDWSHTRRARRIISSLSRDDFRLDASQGSGPDQFGYVGTTTGARRALTRLEHARRKAIDDECGFTFADAQHPFDEVKSHFWLDTELATPSIYRILTDEFDRRARKAA